MKVKVFIKPGGAHVQPEHATDHQLENMMAELLEILARNKNAWFVSWVLVRARSLEKIVNGNAGCQSA